MLYHPFTHPCRLQCYACPLKGVCPPFPLPPLAPRRTSPMSLTDPSSPLNPADTFPSLTFLSLSLFGLPLILPYLTPSSPSPPSFKPLGLVSLLPPRSLFLPLETRHPFSLALNKLVSMCGDSTYHLLPHLNPHPTHPRSPQSSPPVRILVLL